MANCIVMPTGLTCSAAHTGLAILEPHKGTLVGNVLCCAVLCFVANVACIGPLFYSSSFLGSLLPRLMSPHLAPWLLESTASRLCILYKSCTPSPLLWPHRPISVLCAMGVSLSSYPLRPTWFCGLRHLPVSPLGHMVSSSFSFCCGPATSVATNLPVCD